MYGIHRWGTWIVSMSWLLKTFSTWLMAASHEEDKRPHDTKPHINLLQSNFRMNSMTKLASPGLLQGFLGLPQPPSSSSEYTLSSSPNPPDNWNIHEPPLQTPTRPLPIHTPKPTANCFCLLWGIPSPDHQKIPNCQI